MRFSILFLAVLIRAVAFATPTRVVRRADFCGQYDSVETGSYTVYNDLWGESEATSGSECTTIDGLSGSTLSWHTTWTWQGNPSNTKSFAHAGVSVDSQQISAISSMATTWSWSYKGSGLNANVCYDTFTSSSAGGSNEYEVMVWLAVFGDIQPLSTTYNSDGKAPSIASPTIGGKGFKLYKGPNGSTTVYTFIANSKTTDFNGDISDFFNYLINNEGFPSSQYLTSFSAGTETFTGSNADFTVSALKVSIS